LSTGAMAGRIILPVRYSLPASSQKQISLLTAGVAQPINAARHVPVHSPVSVVEPR
jgi:hypothetical protein